MKKGIYAKYESVEIINKIYVFARESFSNEFKYDLGSENYINTEYILDENSGYALSGYKRDVRRFVAGEVGYRDFSTQNGISTLWKYKYSTTDKAEKKVIFNVFKRIANLTNQVSYSKGTYLTDIIADYGSLPADGRHSDGYWYVFVKMASDLKTNVGGIWRDAPTGFVNVGGIWRAQSEFKANVNGIFR